MLNKNSLYEEFQRKAFEQIRIIDWGIGQFGFQLSPPVQNMNRRESTPT